METQAERELDGQEHEHEPRGRGGGAGEFATDRRRRRQRSERERPTIYKKMHDRWRVRKSKPDCPLIALQGAEALRDFDSS